jgi:hypothetical protein
MKAVHGGADHWAFCRSQGGFQFIAERGFAGSGIAIDSDAQDGVRGQMENGFHDVLDDLLALHWSSPNAGPIC